MDAQCINVFSDNGVRNSCRGDFLPGSDPKCGGAACDGRDGHGATGNTACFSGGTGYGAAGNAVNCGRRTGGGAADIGGISEGGYSGSR